MNDLPHQSKEPNTHAVGSLTNRQKNIAKGHLINSCNKSYGIFLSFSPLHQEFTPGFCLSDILSNRFSFNLTNKKEKDKDKTHVQELDNMVLCISSSPNTALIVTDASIKNDITTLISHIHQANRPLIKTVYHAVFITSSEAELFAIRYSINQACNKEDVSKIVVITDSIHTAKNIFSSSSHPYQLHSTAILSKLCWFFNKSHDNSIEFWECPSRLKWKLHKDIDKDSKSFNPTSSFPCKISWDYCRKLDCDNITKQWKMTFQASDGKGKQFLNLLDDNFNTIKLAYTRGGPWMQIFSHSTLLCAHVTRAITNYTPIGEYRLRFFPNENINCPCGNYPIELRGHILHKC